MFIGPQKTVKYIKVWGINVKKLLENVTKNGKELSAGMESSAENIDLVLKTGQDAIVKLGKRVLIVCGAIALGASTVWEPLEGFVIRTQEMINTRGLESMPDKDHDVETFRFRGRPANE